MSVVNKKYKHIFVHNPKVAGTSIESMEFVGGSSHQTLYGFQYYGVDIESYFKWMFVRNPYDRLLSAYNYHKKDKNHLQNCRWMLDSFETYVKNLDELFDFNNKNFGGGTHDYVSVHVIPQYYFCSIDGVNKADFIGKYESLNRDWKTISIRLTGKKINLGTENTSAKRNKYIYKLKKYIDSKTKIYLKNYNEDMVKIVNNKYQKDFIMFDYKMIK